MRLFTSGKSSIDCRIILLDNTEQRHSITNKSLGEELLTKVFVSLDLYEREYFGLKYKDRNGKSHWLDPTKIVKKQILTDFNAPVYTFYFGVKFYAADPAKLREEITRYQFFMQVKKDLLEGRITCEQKVCAELCAFSVQSELGDYEPSVHNTNCISQFRFVPQQTKDLEDLIFESYKQLRGLLPVDAELKFLDGIKWQEMYGVDLRPVEGQDHMDYLLGLSPTGIVLFKNNNKIGSFIWPKITKLKYKGQCFLLRAHQGRNDEEKEYTFLLGDKEQAKSLWKSCAQHHTFFRLEKTNDVPASAHNFLFRKGSGLRFSGRTQKQIENEVDSRPRIQPSVHRTPSQKYERSEGMSKSNPNLNTRRGGSPVSDLNESIDRNQGGLYGSQKNLFPNQAVDRRTSPKYGRSGYSSSGEAEQRQRRRNHYYSGYTSTGEETPKTGITRHGSAPDVQHKTHLHEQLRHQPRHTSREYLGNPVPGPVPTHRGYRVSGSKSDGEDSSRRHRQNRYQQHHRNTDSEMVAPLDVYKNGVQQQRRPHHPQNNNRRAPKHHRHTYDPNQAQLLLELGPKDPALPPPPGVEMMHPNNTPYMHPSYTHMPPPHQPNPYLQQYLPQHLMPAQQYPPPHHPPHPMQNGVFQTHPDQYTGATNYDYSDDEQPDDEEEESLFFNPVVHRHRAPPQHQFPPPPPGSNRPQLLVRSNSTHKNHLRNDEIQYQFPPSPPGVNHRPQSFNQGGQNPHQEPHQSINNGQNTHQEHPRSFNNDQNPHQEHPRSFNNDQNPHQEHPRSFNNDQNPHQEPPQSFNNDQNPHQEHPRSFNNDQNPYQEHPRSFNNDQNPHQEPPQSFNNDQNPHQEHPRSFNNGQNSHQEHPRSLVRSNSTHKGHQRRKEDFQRNAEDLENFAEIPQGRPQQKPLVRSHSAHKIHRTRDEFRRDGFQQHEFPKNDADNSQNFVKDPHALPQQEPLVRPNSMPNSQHMRDDFQRDDFRQKELPINEAENVTNCAEYPQERPQQKPLVRSSNRQQKREQFQRENVQQQELPMNDAENLEDFENPQNRLQQKPLVRSNSMHNSNRTRDEFQRENFQQREFPTHLSSRQLSNDTSRNYQVSTEL